MEISIDKIERLSFIKYLLSQANIQKNLERPLCSSAILTIHDCIECFLQLCFESKTEQPKLNQQNILDSYSEQINNALALEGKQQINKAFIKRINDLRVQLKHKTIFVDHKQIPKLYTETELFLADFTELIFGLSFENISLVSLIPNEIIRKILQEAEKYIEKNEHFNAMRSIGIAFYELENSLTKVKGTNDKNVFGSNFHIDYLTKYSAQLGGSNPDSILTENLIEIANDINKIQDEIISIKTILSLSVNIKDYMLFKEKTPQIHKIRKSNDELEYYALEDKYDIKPQYSLQDVKGSLNFVIDLALQT